MARPVPKLAQRQGIRQQTPPPLVQWDLNELEQSRWEALNSHSKIFASSNHFTSGLATSSPRFPKQPQIPEPKPKQRAKNPDTKSPLPPSRPNLMPNLDSQQSAIPLYGKSLLEKAEIAAAAEAIDQNSLRFQVKLRKNVEAIHEEDLKLKENLWKEKIAKKRDELEMFKKRQMELSEVVKKYSGKKGMESVASKELARVIELKGRVIDELNLSKIKKENLEKTMNELQLDLEKNSLNYEGQEKHFTEELEELKRQVEMSENEKLDSVAFTKENLSKKKFELLDERQKLIDKWQVENKDFRKIFSQTDEQRAEIRSQLRVLKNEKDLLQGEKQVLENKIKEFEQEKAVIENNKKTLGLFKNFEDPMKVKGLEDFEKIFKESVKKIVRKEGGDEEFEEGGNEFGEFLRVIRRNLGRRKADIVKNSEVQVKLIDEQINGLIAKRTKSLGKISVLKEMLNKLEIIV